MRNQRRPKIDRLLAEQATGVGGSELHHLFSLEPWGCRRRLGYKKLRVTPDFPEVETPDMQRGSRLEPTVAALYCEQTGRQIRNPHGACVRSETAAEALCHPDRIIVPRRGRDPEGLGVLEIKCPGLRGFSAVKRQGLPESWLLQLQHNLLCTGYRWGSFAVFSAELWQLLVLDVERDAALCGKILDEVRSFWHLTTEKGILAERLPPGSPQCGSCPWRTRCQGAALLEWRDRQEGAADRGGEIDGTLEPLVRDYLSASALVDDAEALKEQARASLEAALGERLRVDTSGGRVRQVIYEQHRLDGAALRADHPEIASKYERKSVVRSLKVLPP